MRQFVSSDQWIERTPSGVRYFDGVNRGFADTLEEALVACQERYDYARDLHPAATSADGEPDSHESAQELADSIDTAPLFDLFGGDDE